MLLIALMVFQTASLLVLDSAEAASGRGGDNDDLFHEENYNRKRL